MLATIQKFERENDKNYGVRRVYKFLNEELHIKCWQSRIQRIMHKNGIKAKITSYGSGISLFLVESRYGAWSYEDISSGRAWLFCCCVANYIHCIQIEKGILDCLSIY